jgi:hypothetical protein
LSDLPPRPAIVSAKDQNSLDNFGTIFSDNGNPGTPANDFSGSGVSVVNEAGAAITGFMGVLLEKSGTVENFRVNFRRQVRLR